MQEIATVLVPIAMALAVAALVWAHRSANTRVISVAKPLASALFVVLAASRWTPGDTYGTWMLAGLLLGFVGDQLLLSERLFPAGLAAFLVGHLAYLVASLHALPLRSWSLLPLLPLLVLLITVVSWLWPNLGRLRLAVLAYIAVISVMVWGATAAVLGAAVFWTALPGAWLFFLADISVARQRFMHKAFINRALGLPTYYTAQLLLAFTIGTVAG